MGRNSPFSLYKTLGSVTEKTSRMLLQSKERGVGLVRDTGLLSKVCMGAKRTITANVKRSVCSPIRCNCLQILHPFIQQLFMAFL